LVGMEVGWESRTVKDQSYYIYLVIYGSCQLIHHKEGELGNRKLGEG